MKHILIADDSSSLAHALAACLDAGYAVSVTCGSAEALACAGRLVCCDLLVTDYQMPGMDGAELATQVRALHPAAKVLLLTGHGEDLTLADDPSDARLDKPFGPAQLRAAVHALIGPP